MAFTTLKRTKPTVLDVDHVVICAGQVSNTDLFEDIKKVNPNVQLIGGAFKAAELDAVSYTHLTLPTMWYV